MTDSQGTICRSIPGKRLSGVLGLRVESRVLSPNFLKKLDVERSRPFLKPDPGALPFLPAGPVPVIPPFRVRLQRSAYGFFFLPLVADQPPLTL